MTILFCALHFGYFRNFESAICLLAERGHRVRLVAEEPERFGGFELVERLAATYANVSWAWAPDREGETWVPISRKLRYALEYVRFLDAQYAGRPKLRQRAAQRAPRVLLWLLRLPLVGSRPGLRALRATLATAERLMPTSRVIEKLLRAERPDVVLLASLTYSRSQQFDYLKAARALGIPTGACVMGFDHLSSKALLHVAPDRVFVWNGTQTYEAVELHGLPAERLVCTGAQCYDQWFNAAPSSPKEAFCRSVGLAPDRPYILYVCSAMSPDPHEARFVLEWIGHIRDSQDPRLRGIGLLIRPHPERTREWDDIDLTRSENVALHGRNPIDAEAKADYFDALYHSAAVVGIVTSAFLEAAIVGRPVLTLLMSQFHAHQEGMLHFEYLLRVDGGLLITARSFEEHLAQLVRAMAGHSGHEAQTSRFLRAFIRPHGLDRPATPIFVDAVERLGQLEQAPAAAPAWWEQALRPAVRVLALAGTGNVGMRLLMDPLEAGEARIEHENQRRKAGVVAAKEERQRQRLIRQQELVRAKQRHLRQRDRRKIVARVKGRVKQLVGFTE
jgi:hypothetical protein